MKRFILASLSLICLAIYLYVTAPPPLEAAAPQQDRTIPAAQMFEAVNAINAAARQIYTARIVGQGKTAGLAFNEDWKEQGVEAGPLPALFLREVSANLERMPVPLGLYLGSDKPINPSNKFADDSSTAYTQVLATRAPVIETLVDYGKVAMFPDFASAQPCVTCHNEHVDSPKTDWKMDDVMGATTWTWPDDMVSDTEMDAAIRATYGAVALAWDGYLKKATLFGTPPEIGAVWPGEGRHALPDTETFMRAVLDVTAAPVMAQKLAATGALPSGAQEGAE
ncbi:c-type heme family protein [Sagittula sp. S175]|uniref:c-type heme family protein n=1 Tax=Sagittula sp. S175 TaxID=3415129 RepID=UPI003C7CE50E